MTFNQLLTHLIDETTKKSLGHFSPELALCVTIVGLLLLRMVAGKGRGIPAIYGPRCWAWLVAFGLAYCQLAWMSEPGSGVRDEFFTGLLVYDKFTVFFRLFLLLFLILVIALTVISGIPDHEDGARLLHAASGLDGRHDADGVGQPSADVVCRHRDDQRPQLRHGRLSERAPAIAARRLSSTLCTARGPPA